MSTHGAADPARVRALALAALGVVYGDIGTSPLYAFKESLHATGHPGTAEVLGLLSLILWALILIVSVKYITFVLRADHRGEGGILALVGMLFDREYCGKESLGPRMVKWISLVGIFGAALLYGDGMITPAISVLSAVEGLEYAAPSLHAFVVPIAVLILLGLFVAQRVGTGRVGNVFGPVMLAWFSFLAVTGLWNLLQHPAVLWAFNPLPGLQHLVTHGFSGFLVLGSVFLAVTGAEALYADLGHFGKIPIRLGWNGVVLPALAINYLGQGARVLMDHHAMENPFYASTPSWALIPAIILATSATIIASQALISGAFSLTLQAMYLGYCPRMEVKHTSHHERGQVYIPQINWLLMVACIALVLGFQSSGALASAYGIAVTLTMVITTLLFSAVARKAWGWSPLFVGIFAAFFLVIELGFFGANLFKIFHGGWFALAAAGIIFLLMTTWKTGREALFERLRPTLVPVDDFLKNIQESRPQRVPGTSIFLSSVSNSAPLALLHNLHHNQVLHETVVIITISTELRAFLEPSVEPITVQNVGNGFYRVTARFGYMETPNVPLVVSLLPDFGVPLNSSKMTYFLSRERLVAAGNSRLGPLRRSLFSFLARNSTSPADFFCLPANKVVELGVQVGC